ncbi:hypothetical protein H7J88_09125 [Mycolicibacterium flavescens]|nr:hypothetical protein [Mycolicibacterium flavescens]MCV7279812.1 hypothetical protein [Mycolicibacterium flavescens]
MTEQSAELHEYQETVPKMYIALAWVWVGVPFAYGVYELLIKVKALFVTG